jgi:hypothetical protein
LLERKENCWDKERSKTITNGKVYGFFFFFFVLYLEKEGESGIVEILDVGFSDLLVRDWKNKIEERKFEEMEDKVE